MVFTLVFFVGHLFSKASATLENKPPEVVFPADLSEKIHHNDKKKLIIFKGVMSEEEKKQLIGLSQDILYMEAVEELFQGSQSKEVPLESRQKEGNAVWQEWYHDLFNSFYASVVTFTTVGFGDIGPRGWFKVAAIIEGVLGWLTMALFLVTLGRVWLR